MLSKSLAVAALVQTSASIIGVPQLRRNFNIASVIDAYGPSVTPMGSGRYELELDSLDWQAAVLGDLEDCLDRSLSQALIYWDLVERDFEPAWTAITGYYAAFFAIRALAVASGVATRRLPATVGMPNGYYTYRTSPSVYPSRVVLSLSPGPKNSHASAWSTYAATLGSLAATNGLDSRSKLVLSALRAIVLKPRGLSEVRNDINYAVEASAWSTSQWSSKFRSVRTESDLEDEILAAAPLRDEQRIELALLSATSLAASSFEAYLTRTPRPDRRRSGARRARLAAATSPAIPVSFDGC